MPNNHISEIIAYYGGRQKVADLLGLTYMAVKKWEIKGKFPRTEYTGETNYAETLAENSDGKFTVDNLLHKSKTPSGH